MSAPFTEGGGSGQPRSGGGVGGSSQGLSKFGVLGDGGGSRTRKFQRQRFIAASAGIPFSEFKRLPRLTKKGFAIEAKEQFRLDRALRVGATARVLARIRAQAAKQRARLARRVARRATQPTVPPPAAPQTTVDRLLELLRVGGDIFAAEQERRAEERAGRRERSVTRAILDAQRFGVPALGPGAEFITQSPFQSGATFAPVGGEAMSIVDDLVRAVPDIARGVGGIFSAREARRTAERMNRGPRSTALTRFARTGFAPDVFGSMAPFVADPGLLEEPGLFEGFESDIERTGVLFRRTAAGVRAQRAIEARHPTSGRIVTWLHAGRPLLYTGDLAACKRVNRIAGRAMRRMGGRRSPRRFRRS